MHRHLGWAGIRVSIWRGLGYPKVIPAHGLRPDSHTDSVVRLSLARLRGRCFFQVRGRYSAQLLRTSPHCANLLIAKMFTLRTASPTFAYISVTYCFKRKLLIRGSLVRVQLRAPNIASTEAASDRGLCRFKAWSNTMQLKECLPHLGQSAMHRHNRAGCASSR